MPATPCSTRLCSLLRHLRRPTAPPRLCPTPAPTAAAQDGDDPLIGWDEIRRHNTRNDLWIVVNGRVFDMTEFIREESGHPGGADIPLEYGGKDASEFWTDMHGHLEEEILEDVLAGELNHLADAGLEALPTFLGVADGPPPAGAVGEAFPSTNWAGNVVWANQRMAQPETLEELCEVVREEEGTVRVVGRAHSFTPVCDSDDLLISLAKMNRVISLDDEAGTVTVEGGITYTVLNKFLSETKWAMKNLATLPHFTVAGSMSMGTHGSSGVNPETGRPNLGNQGSQVCGIKFVLGDGSVRSYDRDPDDHFLDQRPLAADEESRRLMTTGDGDKFRGAICALGCLGVVAEITLSLKPRYSVTQARYVNIGLDTFIDNFPEMLSKIDSFSGGPRWVDDKASVLVRHFVPWGETAVPEYPPPNWVPWEGDWGVMTGDDTSGWSRPPQTGPWYDMMCTVGPGIEEDPDRYGLSSTFESREVQAEYFVPLEHAQPALRAVWKVAKERGLGGSELRVVRGDDHWLSPCGGRDCLVIHFGLYKFNMAKVMRDCAALEEALMPFEVRPHWGKLHAMGADTLTAHYGDSVMEKFRDLCNEHDPEGTFRNAWVRRLVFGEQEDHLELIEEVAGSGSESMRAQFASSLAKAESEATAEAEEN